MTPSGIHTLLLGLLAGCYQPPSLPLLDEVPLVPRPEDLCREPVDEQRVSCVIDGDTFDIGACGDPADERIRLLGVAAPEIAHDQPAECYGDEAHDALDDLLTGRELTLTFDTRCEGVYGRTLAYAWLLHGELSDSQFSQEFPDTPTGEGGFVNEWLLRWGYARRYNEDLEGDLLLGDRLDRAEEEARNARRGLWSACGSEGG